MTEEELGEIYKKAMIEYSREYFFSEGEYYILLAKLLKALRENEKKRRTNEVRHLPISKQE